MFRHNVSLNQYKGPDSAWVSEGDWYMATDCSRQLFWYFCPVQITLWREILPPFKG